MLLLLACAHVAASPGDTYRAGSRVLSPGDPTVKLLDSMGAPDSKEPVQNEFGAQIGEYWYYYVDGKKTVRFLVSGGKIVEIEEIRA